MTKKTVGLCVIIKDDSELEGLKKLINSCKKYINAFYITGNNEPQTKIKSFLRACGGKYHYSFEKWENNFSDMRNFNFSQNKCDYGIWADTDDEIKNPENLKGLVEQMEKTGTNLVHLNYDYTQDTEGYGTSDHTKSRLYKNDGKCYWLKSVHETLNRDDEQSVYSDKVSVIHRYDFKDKFVKDKRNYDILKLEYEKDKDKTDPRTLHYLGNSSYGLAMSSSNRDEMLEQAIFFYSEHIKKSGWDDESYKSYMGIAYCLSILGRNEQAINSLLKATQIRPDWDEAYWLISKCYVDQNNLLKAIEFGEIALIKKEPDTPLGVNKALRKFVGPANLINAYILTNQVTKASKLFNSVNDNSDRMQTLGKIVQDAWEMDDYVNKTLDTILYAKKYDKRAVGKLVENLPDFVMQDTRVQELRIENAPVKQWGKKSVVIMCANSLEDWADPSLIKGIGGSETAVIYLSRELVKKGYDVTVFNRAGKLKGDYKGVKYRNYWEFNPKDSFDWLISWRNPDICKFVNAKQLWLWNHDKVDDFDEETIKKVDKFVFLSRWHKKQTNAPDNKSFITSNGFNMENIPEVQKNPYMMISTSSYDRGLEHLLKNWSTIKRIIPKAELHICYGWDNFDKLYPDKKLLKWKAGMVEMMKQEDVVDHGRVSEKELTKLIAQSNLWTYYSHFWEINCIGAIMAQSLGAIPITTDYAALDETVQYGVKVKGIKEMGVMSKEVEKELVKETINLLKDKVKQEKIRKPMMKWARENYGWEKIVDEWVKEKEKNA